MQFLPSYPFAGLQHPFCRGRQHFWAEGETSLAAGNIILAPMKPFTIYGPPEVGMWPTIPLIGE